MTLSELSMGLGRVFFFASMKNLITTTLIIISTIGYSFATIVVSNGLTKIHDVNAKGVAQGVIVLKNTGSSNESFKCYLNDLSTDCAGSVFYEDPETQRNSLAPFLSTNVTEAELAPGEEYELIYKIDLSESSFYKGTLWSLLMVEVIKPISETTTQAGFSVGSKIRYGVQIISNIGMQEDPVLQFSQVQLGKDVDENKLLEASLENNGDFIALPLVEIQIYNSKGEKVKDLSVPSKKVYPKNCQKFQLPLADLEAGNYKAVLFAEYLESTIGLNIDLEL